MILRLTSAGVFADCEALYEHHHRTISMQTIRARCTVVGVDPETRRNLYDMDEAIEVLASVKPRRPHRKTTRKDEAA